MALGVRRPVYRHYGIYAGKFRDLQCVIHYSDNKYSGGKGRIELASFHDFQQDDEWWIENFGGMEYADAVLALSLRRAVSCLGKRQYHAIFNNCEHFAAWCVTGKAQSRQVEEIMTGLLLAPRQTVQSIIEGCLVTMLEKAVRQYPLITAGVVLGTIFLASATAQKRQQIDPEHKTNDPH
jgi:uncharacterized protein YyaL (SSP411 family)